MRSGAVEQHHGLIVAVDRGDHAANVCAQSHNTSPPASANGKSNLSLLGLTAQPGLIRPAFALPDQGMPRHWLTIDVSPEEARAGRTHEAWVALQLRYWCAARITSDGGVTLA